MSMVLRLVSLVLVALALMVLGADVFVLFETATYAPRTFQGVWGMVHKASADAVAAWVSGLPDFLAGAVLSVLAAPAFVIIGLPGVLIGLFAYGRH